MNKKLSLSIFRNTLGMIAVCIVLGTPVAKADYYDGTISVSYVGGCEQNYRGEAICAGETVRDINTGSIGTVFQIYAYDQVEVQFYSGSYAGYTYVVAADSLTLYNGSGGYYPVPQPGPIYYPNPQPYPSYPSYPSYPNYPSHPYPGGPYYPGPGRVVPGGGPQGGYPNHGQPAPSYPGPGRVVPGGGPQGGRH